MTAPTVLQLAHGSGPHRIVFLPPAGGGITVYLGLAGYLEPHGEVSAIRAQGLYAGESPDTDIPTMVERYLHQLPPHPDVLIGWSLGGVLAWELAARLPNPPAVVMIDSFAHFPTLSPPARESLIDTVIGHVTVPEERALLHRTAVAHIQAAAAHRVRTTFTGETLLLSCTDALATQWTPLASRLRTRRLACTHFEACTAAQLPTLSGYLDEFMASLDKVR